jgi:hypothetical protein
MCVFKYHAFIFYVQPPRWRCKTVSNLPTTLSGVIFTVFKKILLVAIAFSNQETKSAINAPVVINFLMLKQCRKSQKCNCLSTWGASLRELLYYCPIVWRIELYITFKLTFNLESVSSYLPKVMMKYIHQSIHSFNHVYGRAVSMSIYITIHTYNCTK